MQQREKTDNVPTDCAAMQQKVDVLKWAQGALKLLPNLPKGKLKEELELDLSSTLSGAATLRGQTSTQLSEMIKSVRSYEQTLSSIGKLKRPGPNDIATLRDFIAEVGIELESFREKLETLLRPRF